MDQPLNRQNDRVYIKEGTKKPLSKKTIVEKNKFSRKLMVWAGVAYNLKTDLVLFRQGETVNADRYQSAILAPLSSAQPRFPTGLRPLPHGNQIRRIFDDGKYRFLDERRLAAKLPLISIPLTTVYGVCWSRRCTVSHQRICRTWRTKFDELGIIWICPKLTGALIDSRDDCDNVKMQKAAISNENVL